jgi:hypothetical protein
MTSDIKKEMFDDRLAISYGRFTEWYKEILQRFSAGIRDNFKSMVKAKND